MRRDALRSSGSALLLATLLGASPAVAQGQRQAPAIPTPVAPAAPVAPTPAPAAAASTAPERTTSQFGDWTVTCVGVGEERRCEAAHVVQDRQTQTSAALAAGRVSRDAPMRLVLRAPVNVTVTAPARIALDGTETITLPFRTCNVIGCFADLEIQDQALLGRLRARSAEQPARLEWRDAAGNPIGFMLPFRGFAAALDALARETR